MKYSESELSHLTQQLNAYANTIGGDDLMEIEIGNLKFRVPGFEWSRERMQISAYLVSPTGHMKLRPLSDEELGQVCIQVLMHGPFPFGWEPVQE